MNPLLTNEHHLKRALLAILIALLIYSVTAQRSSGQIKTTVGEIGKIVDVSGWLEFNSDSSFIATDVFDKHRTKFGLSSRDEMKPRRQTESTKGLKHYHYQQYYDGLEIEGAEFIIHEKNGKAYRANGKVVSDLSIETIPTISTQDALEAALKSMPAKVYSWEDEYEEMELKRRSGDTSATHYPIPELVITRRNDEYDVVRGNMALAYRVDLYSMNPQQAYSIYVDAHSGNTFKKYSLIHGCTGNVIGSADLLYNGTQDINTKQVGSEYVLHDQCRGNGIRTTLNGAEVTNSSTTWTTNKHLTQTHWAGMMTYDYFLDKHGLNSYDGLGSIMTHKVSSGTLYAQFLKDKNFETGYLWLPTLPVSSSYYHVALDIVGHEWTHGLMVRTRMDYTENDETKALSESFGDIFGALIECYAEGLYDTQKSCNDYYFADELDPTLSALFVRSMCDPDDLGDAGTYLGTHWFTPGEERYYSYTGPQNKWFCLLSNGGEGVNDHICESVQYSIEPIGSELVGQVVFHSITNYMNRASMYRDARIASIWSAEDLELTTTQIQAIKDAWDAVGVYSTGYYSDPPNVHVSHNLAICGTFTSSSDPAVFKVFKSIEAGTACPEPDEFTLKPTLVGCVDIEPNATIQFLAGESVNLRGEFHAKEGSDFRAQIVDPCPTFFPTVVPTGTTGTTAEGEPFQGSGSPPRAHTPTMIVRPTALEEKSEVRFSLGEDSRVDLHVYNSAGLHALTVADYQTYPKGVHLVVLDAKSLPNGMYFVVLKAGGHVLTRRALIMR